MSPTIDENTKVPLRALLATLAVVGGGIITFAGGVWYLARSLERIDARLESLEASTPLTESKASELALRAAIANPGLKVPDPRDPNSYIRVEIAK